MSKIIRFVHMKPEEIELAKKFLDIIPQNYLKVETSVKLYPPKEFHEEFVREAILEYARAMNISFKTAYEYFKKYHILEMIYENYAKRIDIVIEYPKEIWIVEIKDKLRPSGIGELMVYDYWYRRNFSPLKPIRLVYAVKYRDIMVEEVCKYHNIKFIYIE